MTVSELIKKLGEFDGDRMVVVSGYEGGVDEVIDLENTTIELNVNTAWYYGKHEINENGETKAVRIL